MQPIRFVFGLHLHQPVGNFDHVFADHVRDVYRPLIERIAERGFLPAVLHLSGPLLDWLETHDPSYLDMIGGLASRGQLELLLSGFQEPVLASLPRRDRVEQIQWMHERLRTRFGVDARGLWLTERVWEPELAADLADAGVRYVLVDDRHFLVTGFRSEQLHAPFWTESDGKRVALVPIHERLRYLIPFRPPQETADYLRELRAAGHRLAVLADDGEKFGGWPGTHDWVYGRGWLAQFMDTVAGLVDAGEVVLSTLHDAMADVPSGGLAYLPTASYREMEGWSLPPEAASSLIRLERDLGEERLAGPDGALVRGSHWRNFLVKYPESNRMHKTMMTLSALCRERGDPSSARQAIGRAQCNDAYWHGVFGGLYLPHLREAIWANLAAAEGELRRGQALELEETDFDGDGHVELRVTSGQVAAVVSPRRGGSIEVYSRLDTGINHADVLTRRLEAYHDTALEHHDDPPAGHGDGTPSIHEIEAGIRLDARPPMDLNERGIFQERILPSALRLEEYAGADYRPGRSWVAAHFGHVVNRRGDAIEVVLVAGDGDWRLEKRLRFEPGGDIGVAFRWSPGAGAPGDFFTTELSLFRPLDLDASPAAEIWRYPVETVAKSERGLDRTWQGESVTVRWPVALGEATLRLTAPAG